MSLVRCANFNINLQDIRYFQVVSYFIGIEMCFELSCHLAHVEFDKGGLKL